MSTSKASTFEKSNALVAAATPVPRDVSKGVVPIAHVTEVTESPVLTQAPNTTWPTVAGAERVKESEVEFPALIEKALIWPFTGKSLKTWVSAAVEDKAKNATANGAERRPSINVPS